MEGKRGQAWGFDAMLATGVFITALMVLYFYTLNYQYKNDTTLDQLRYEATLVGDNLLSEGLPSNWNENEVIRLGLLSNGIINQTKLEQFNSLSINNYQKTKALFTIRHEYLISFTEPISVNGSSIDQIGLSPSVNAKNIIAVTRFSAYQNKPITIKIIVWE